MKFTENNRISHRQLYRQMILTFLSPFLLCLFGERKILGIPGILGTMGALLFLVFYVIFLIRLTPYYADLSKFTGKIGSRMIGIFFLSYIILTGAYLLAVLETVIPFSLLHGINGKWLSLAAALVCGFGTHKGMQRRGRMAEVSGALLLGGVIVMMILCLGQSRVSYLKEMSVIPVGIPSVIRNGYGVLCAFSGIGLLPFVLQDVEKQGSAGKTAIFGVLTLGGLIVGMLFLFTGVFGWQRLRTEKYPILPLLAGADLPGNVLARFDVLWMGFLVYSLLFAIGSLFHYGHQVIRQTKLGTGRFWMVIVVYLLSVAEWKRTGIEDYYGDFLGYIFVPGLLLTQFFIMFRGKGFYKRKATSIAGVALFLLLFLGGCSGIEPEKRMFPLALGADITETGYALTYGMPDLPQATGQQKPEEGQNTSVLTIKGQNFREIEDIYNRSQEKYLDLGHLQVIIAGNNILGSEKWEVFLDYLKKEPFVGENVYLFRTQNPEKILAWKGSGGTSVGEYLTGLLENRISGQQKRGVTLRQVYHQKYLSNNIWTLPEIVLVDDQIQVFFE